MIFPRFWAFLLVIFVIFWLNSRDFQEKCSGNTGPIFIAQLASPASAAASVARRFFLEITTFGQKNHENHEQKSSKSRKNHRVFNLNSLKIDPPDLFYCIFMHQYFSKIKNWKYFLLFMKEKYNFSKDNLLKKIRPNFWGKIKIKWTIFQLKNAELSKHFWKISKITKYFQNPLKSRSFRWFVTYHGAQIFVTRVMLKITEFVINHEFWQHC